MALDAKQRLKEAQQRRYSAANDKRKRMLDELEEREREFKKTKVDQHKMQQEIYRENESLMERGRQLREQKEKELQQREEEARKAAEPLVDEPPSLGMCEWICRFASGVPTTNIGPLDTTVRLKYSVTVLPHLTTSESLAALLQPFGETDKGSIVLSIKTKTSKKKKSSSEEVKLATALVPFKRIGDAFAAVYASGVKERGLEGVQITWAGNSGGEPELIGWLKRHGKLGAPSEAAKGQKPSTSSPASVSPLPVWIYPPDIWWKDTPLPVPTPHSVPGLDYESLTLMRMREAERARLEREILEQEAAEG